ncbi:flagellar basal body P-ring formation chaperone FlgA [Bdellovibrio sp. HCB337]|uniref:flagellar basal body P-ring formation chaperone FlgA n=1 Tax=Bdellovibrio sp. HCB337 TaxID=3394358 RepID=UPI0039A6E27E
MKFVQALLLGITMMVSLAWARPEVIFPKEAEVSNTTVISVFQVAELKEITGVAFNEIAKMPLVDQIEKQDSIVLSGEEISKKLRDLVKNSEILKKINPTFRIPSEVRIRIRQDGYSKEEIERSLRNVLVAKCETCKFQIRLNALPKMSSLNGIIDWTQDIKYGSFMIPVREADQFSNKWITGTVRVQKQVPVARKLIRFGERLQQEDLEIQETDITFVKEETPELSQVVGLLANRTLSPRSPVLLSDLKREPATRKGQVVKALVGDSVFEVSINASAEETGFIGDVIKIKNPETQKVMSAIVIDKGVVKVQ